MPAQRRDAQGNRQTAHSWESLVERQIREAMEDGAFRDLPYQGEPLPLEDDSAAGDMAMAHRMLREAGFAPPWIEADKAVRARLAERDALLARAATASPASRPRLRAELERVVREANLAIERLNAEAPTERQHRALLDTAAESAALERVFEA